MKKALFVFMCLSLVVLPMCAFASGSTALQYINFTASSSLGSAAYTVALDPGDLSSIGATVLKSDSGAKIGTISWTAMVTDEYSSFLNFTALSGSADTTFSVNSDIGFEKLYAAQTSGSTSITVTDGKRNGAKLTGGLADGSYAYAVSCNESPSNLQVLLSAPISVSPRSSKTESDDILNQTLYNVTSLNSKYSFTLSAADSASGTSNFGVTPVPEPGSLLALCTGMLGMAGFVVRRRA